MADQERRASNDPDVRDAGLPSSRGVWTGGTLAGDEVTRGSVIKHPGDGPRVVEVPDSIGDDIAVAPEFAGTVAGNTTGAGGVVLNKGPRDSEPADETEDLGPEGTVVQEIGGEARY
jgi:hypothetical protein